MNFDILGFFENLSRNFKSDKSLARLTGPLQ